MFIIQSTFQCYIQFQHPYSSPPKKKEKEERGKGRKEKEGKTERRKEGKRKSRRKRKRKGRKDRKAQWLAHNLCISKVMRMQLNYR